MYLRKCCVVSVFPVHSLHDDPHIFCNDDNNDNDNDNLGRFGGVYSPPFLQDWVPWTIVKRLSWNRDHPMEGGIDGESKEEREKRKLRAERLAEQRGWKGGRAGGGVFCRSSLREGGPWGRRGPVGARKQEGAQAIYLCMFVHLLVFFVVAGAPLLSIYRAYFPCVSVFRPWF